MLRELAGFAMLSVSILVPLAILVVSIIAGVIVGLLQKARWKKWVVGFGTTIIVILIPIWDEILGRIYLNHLCTTEARVKLYRTVELPAPSWDGEGRPKYLGVRGFVDMNLLPKTLAWRNVSKPYIEWPIKIEEWRWQLIDKQTQTVLGERIDYMRHFGWINRFSLAPNIGVSCKKAGSEQERDQEQKFFRDIFKPATSTR